MTPLRMPAELADCQPCGDRGITRPNKLDAWGYERRVMREGLLLAGRPLDAPSSARSCEAWFKDLPKTCQRAYLRKGLAR